MSEFEYDRLVQEGCYLRHAPAGGTKMENVTNEPCEKKRGSVCLEAVKTINGARQDAYGNPEDSFKGIGELWAAWGRAASGSFGSPRWDAAMRMALMKIARIANGVDDRDSYRDAIGYLALACDMACATDKEKD